VASKLEETALSAARAAGRVHLRWLNRTRITRKSNAIDLVTEADQEAERAVIRRLRRTFPSHAILAEESGADGGGASGHRWIIDPVDGTTNFAHGYPNFCVSIAYERKGRVELGVVLDAYRKECFLGIRRRGARLNGARIRTSRTPKLEHALLGTGFAYDRRERRHFYFAFWEAFMMRVQGIRRSGSAALDLCNVACGRFDAFWEFSLKAWDVAAGALIIEEAGGQVTNADGSALGLDAGNIMASNGILHAEMLATLKKVWPEAERRFVEARPAP